MPIIRKLSERTLSWKVFENVQNHVQSFIDEHQQLPLVAHLRNQPQN